MELMRLISVYAVLHVLMMFCFIERSLSKMKPRLRTVPENSTLVLLREIVCGCGNVVLIEDDDEKRIASVLLFSLKKKAKPQKAKWVVRIVGGDGGEQTRKFYTYLQ